MDKIKVGVMGIGNMGRSHASKLYNGEIKGAKLTAVCDVMKEKLEWVKHQFGDDIQLFQDEDHFFNEANIDAIIIATPHYQHPKTSMRAFSQDLHVLLEKPVGVYTKNVREMNELSQQSDLVFSMMYNQRTNPLFQKVRDLIQSGELGEIKRTNWIITDWYRSQSYYDSSEWRATWKGEGGGVLLNQAPHQLDLWQWTTGLMPKKVRGFMQYGKYHEIEVEDDVTAYVEYENGATGVFITSTGEAPGTNRFEIVGDRGKIVVENNKLTFYRLTQSERDFNATDQTGFGRPECWEIDVPIKGVATDHAGIMQNWVNAIRTGEELLAPGIEGIKGLEISNAIYLSSWLDETVELPLNEDLFYDKLKERMDQSQQKKSGVNRSLDISNSF